MTKQLGRAETRYSQDPYPQVGGPQAGANHNCRNSPQGERGPSPTSGSPASGVLRKEDKPPEHLALKPSRTHFQESQKATGNRDTTRKGRTENRTAPNVRQKQSSEGSLARPISCLGESLRVSEKAGGNWVSPWPHRYLQQPRGGAHPTWC